MNIQKNISTSLGIIILIVLAILIGGGILIYQYGWQPKSSGVTTPQDETVGWQVYENNGYGFEIKHSKDWQFEVTVVNSIKIRKSTSGSYFEIVENKNENNLNLDEWFKEATIINGRPTVNANAKKIFINGVEAYRVDSELQPPNPLFEIVGIANSQRKIFSFYAYSGQLDDNTILEKMLFTFKFTK